jgi:hypothetical protein
MWDWKITYHAAGLDNAFLELLLADRVQVIAVEVGINAGEP